jgi:hypothetical protein
MLRKLVLFAIVGTIAGAAAQAQAPAADPKLDAAIAQLRKDAAAGKNDLINANMSFTADEAAAFWPLYKAYEAKRNAIGDERVALIKDYAASYDTLTDEKAKELVTRAWAIEDKVSAARKAFLQELQKTMPAKRVARYAQVENRIEMLINLQLAAGIPLAK